MQGQIFITRRKYLFLHIISYASLTEFQLETLFNTVATVVSLVSADVCMSIGLNARLILNKFVSK